MSRGALLILLAVASAASRAEEPLFADTVIAGAQHDAGAMKWRDELVRTASYMCSKTATNGSVDCVLNVVRVRNESTQPIQCHLAIEHVRPDDSDRRTLEADVVVYPGREAHGAESRGPAALVAKRFYSTCIAIPATMPPLPIVPECRGKLSSPSPDAFFPPDSRRRDETGDVILEYGVVKNATRPLNVLVVGSSGYQELDTAALLLAKDVSIGGQCLGRRYRFKVRFLISAGEPPPG